MTIFINCPNCGQYKPHNAHGLCINCYRRIRRIRKPKFRKYRIKRVKYHGIYKPHFKYSDYNGYVFEHRYIMYLYLSILNNKVTYLSKDDDIHHINGNRLDNRIENLQLISRSEHAKISHPIIDKSSYYCNICKSNKTRKMFKNNKYYDNWHDDIEGHLCNSCYRMLRYYRNKFGM